MTYTGSDAPLTTTDPAGRVDRTSYLVGYSHPIGHIDAFGRHECFRYDYDMRLSYIYDIDCPTNKEVPYGPLTPMIERRSFQYTAVGQMYLAQVMPDNAHPWTSIMYSYDSLGRTVNESVDVNAPPIGSYSIHHEDPERGANGRDGAVWAGLHAACAAGRAVQRRDLSASTAAAATSCDVLREIPRVEGRDGAPDERRPQR